MQAVFFGAQMKNLKTPRTLADTQFTTGYPQSGNQEFVHKVLSYIYVFAIGFVLGLVLGG